MTPATRASSSFALHDTLERDTFPVARWALSRVLLMNDANFPWLILVPERPGLRDLHDLLPNDLAKVMDEIVRASRALQGLFKPDKMNVAALGNMVPQLHIHVIARFDTDPAWPKPVWGAVPARSYEQEIAEELVSDLRAAFAAL